MLRKEAQAIASDFLRHLHATGRWLVLAGMRKGVRRLAMALVLALAGCATTGGHRGVDAAPGRVASRRPARMPVRLASAGGGVVPESGVERLVQALALGGVDVVEQAFEEAWTLGQDDFALKLLEATSGETLSRVVQAPEGRRQVGVAKEGIAETHYADQLAVDMATVKSSKPHVEAFSCKSRSFKGLNDNEMRAIVDADGKEALTKYGGRIEVRRPEHPLFERRVEVTKVHLVYEAKLVERDMQRAIIEAGAELGVKVHFQ